MIVKEPVVLIYNRTHKGDPSPDGIFGIHDCMGSVRNRKYDAVIGIGGKQPLPKDKDIAWKINWIGINPTKDFGVKKSKGPLVTFDRFCLFDESGDQVADIAPNLYKYMYEGARRVVMSTSLPGEIYEEVKRILSLIDDCPPSTITLKELSIPACANENCS